MHLGARFQSTPPKFVKIAHVPSTMTSRSPRPVSPRPHRPLFRTLWALWQRPEAAVPSRSASSSTWPASSHPHRPLFRTLWALWQRPEAAVPSRSASSSTWPASPHPHRPLFRLLWALWQCRGHCHSWGGTSHRLPGAERSGFGQNRYPNIALILALVCNMLGHRVLCRGIQFVSMLGCLKNRQNGPFRAILTLQSFGPLFTIRWLIEHYAKAANLRPC